MNHSQDHLALRVLPSGRRFVTLLTLFAVTRLLFAAAGGRFASEGLTWYWQFLDVDLLRTDLVRSLIYLHIQPPLFNLLLGTILKTAGVAGFPLVAHALFAMIGLSLVVSFDYFLRRMRYHDDVAICVSVAIVCLPEFCIYENYLFYPYAVAASLAWSVVSLDRYLQTHAFAHAMAFFSTVAIAVLTWAFYQPALLLALIIALASHARVCGWRVGRVLEAAAAPAALVLAVCVKNLFLFGFPGTSSQGALNLSQSTVFALPLEVRQHEVRSGVFSPLAVRAGPFRPVEELEEDLGREPASGIPALDQRTRASGVPNFNHAIYVRASRALESDVVRTITHYPRTYLRSCLQAFSLFFQPAYRYSHVPTIRNNLVVLAPVLWLFDLAHGLWTPAATAPSRGLSESIMRTGWLMAGLYAVVHVTVLWMLFHGGYAADRALGAAMSYAWLLSVYTMVVGIAVQAGENNRFRFSAELLVLMLLFYVCSGPARRAVRALEMRPT